MTAKTQRREGIAMCLRLAGGRSRSEVGPASLLRTSTARAVTALSLLCAVQAAAQPAAKFTNLTLAQAQTLLALARDYHPREGLPESQYASCIAPYDVQAGNAQDRQRMDEALVLVDGAVRRMGYTSYAAITDDYERTRLARMLGEKRWIKQFRTEVGQCLDRSSQPR
jgi:hypothetical protein